MIELVRTVNLREIIGEPEKGIIFSDVDGVWLDENNNFTPPNKSKLEIIQSAKQAGYWVVLVSDTGSIALSQYAEQFDANSPVIAENGAYIYLPQQNIKLYTEESRAQFFQNLTNSIENQLNQKPNVVVYRLNATPYIQTTKNINEKNKTIYLINSAREESLGIYIRQSDNNGILSIDVQKTEETKALFVQEVEKILPPSQKMIVKSYPQIGSCLVKNPKIQKWKAVQLFIESFPQDLRYYMIGDTENDSMQNLGRIVTNCAVGNATDAYKKIIAETNGLVAPQNKTIADGAFYLIEQIIQEGK